MIAPVKSLLDCLAFGHNQGRNWDDLDWEALIACASREQLLPLLRSRLEEIGVLPSVPADVASFLSAVEELSLERNQAIQAELVTVVKILNQHGLEPVLLKGAAYLNTGVYATPAHRYLLDVDLLVPESKIGIAVQALVENGFDWDRDCPLGQFRHHHPALRRPGQVWFELHHSLGLGKCKSLLPASEVIEQSVPHEIEGARIRIPAANHLMTHLIMHSQIQHPCHERIWPPLRAMYDLVRMRARFDPEIDWPGVARRFERVGRSSVLELHLLQVRDALKLEPPFPIRMTGLTYLAWVRRKALRAAPALRFLDPLYMGSAVLSRRLLLAQTVLRTPGAWRVLLQEMLAPRFYRRVFADVIEGRGR